MALTDKQIRWIKRNAADLLPEQMAERFKVSVEEIEKHLPTGEQKKSPWYFSIIAIMIPILFFVLIEVVLRVGGYGIDRSQWEELSRGKIWLNQNFAARYFQNTKNLPHTIKDSFYAEKQDSTYRVFVLGGSSAAGYPYMPMGSFSRYIRKRLEIMYPSIHIEVVNVAMTAVNTYTIRDMLPGVLDKEPDLILIYAGHNEFYGALGAGSMESLGRSRAVVNLILFLDQFKTWEFLRNTVTYVMASFSDEPELSKQNTTLMAVMAQEKQIPLGSEIYNAGIEQFTGNMRDILEMITDENVPVIVGTLASNVKDLKPFISNATDGLPSANEIYDLAEKTFNDSDYVVADSLYRLAKDLDMLRFRASEEINEIIFALGKEFSIPIVNIDSVFAGSSEGGITGKNLMVDHLHPTLEGYKLMGKAFYELMEITNYLPEYKSRGYGDQQQHSMTRNLVQFTKFDSVVAEFRIAILENDWPFVEPDEKRPLPEIIQLDDFVDSVAFEFLYESKDWEFSQRKLAVWYIKQGNVRMFKKQVENLIYQYPFVLEYYNLAANEFIVRKMYSEAKPYLERRYKIEPDFFSVKWLGLINLYNLNTKDAIRYLTEALEYDENDSQILYNLAGAYTIKSDWKTADALLKKALAIKPDYPEATKLHQQVKARL